LGGKLLSATELVPCLLQLELVRVVGAMWGAAGALLPGALWVGRGGRVPSLKFSSAGPRRTWLERCQSFRFFTTDWARWVFCILKFKKRQGNKKSRSRPFTHNVPSGEMWYFCHSFPRSKYWGY